jgi:hypothetical protein
MKANLLHQSPLGLGASKVEILNEGIACHLPLSSHPNMPPRSLRCPIWRPILGGLARLRMVGRRGCVKPSLSQSQRSIFRLQRESFVLFVFFVPRVLKQLLRIYVTGEPPRTSEIPITTVLPAGTVIIKENLEPVKTSNLVPIIAGVLGGTNSLCSGLFPGVEFPIIALFRCCRPRDYRCYLVSPATPS